ncbi:hypothetical protein BDA99DRAFT_504378 [Phascolomyces articulosus]|uniref:ANK_REP_REGION domain-containing protein n=1 Tax=Phascolomyces articulosus TaxID=60185 RepID=A0AAD5K397_9FUNG|nr:hypothetical protein BDA99DRAFT_504378 [Phascolomyces articulosus]
MAAVYHDSLPHHHLNNNNNTARKQCSSASCCSPLRLWRTLQTIIQKDAKEEFSRLSESTPQELFTRVLLTSRLANDPSLYSPSQKSRVIQFPLQVRQEAVRKLGKPTTDLNALQLALVLKSTSVAFQILGYLKQHASKQQLDTFLGHVWGQRNTTLHLACFWNMSRLVRLLLDLGADTMTRNTRLVLPVDCCTNTDCLVLLSTTTTNTTTRQKSTTSTPPLKPLQQRPSMLLKKAAERSMSSNTPPPALLTPSPSPRPVQVIQPSTCHQQHEITPTEFFDKKSPPPPSSPLVVSENDHHRAMIRMSPMSFSSSSSSSSFSSLSSTEDGTIKSSDDLWTPPPSPMTTTITKKNNTFPSSSPPPSPSCWSPIHDDENTTTTVVMGFPSSPPSPVPTRPACFPTMRSILPHDNDDDDGDEEVQQEIKNTLSLVSASPEPEQKPRRRQVRFDPKVVLMDACTRGDLSETIDLLDSATSDMNDAYNRSLLHIALMNGHEKIVKLLIDSNKMDVNHADNNGIV